MGRKQVFRSKEEIRIIKGESRKRHKSELRRALAVAHYLRLTAAEQHSKATTFVKELEQKYPTKRDIRKTPEYREWERQQLSIPEERTPVTAKSKKEMVLRIPLIQSNAKATQSVLGEIQPQQQQQDHMSSIFEEIPNDIMKQMIEEISTDPDLAAFMNDFCGNEEVPDIDSDIILDIDPLISPLEVEINTTL